MRPIHKVLRIWTSLLLLALLAAAAQADTSRQEFAAALQKWRAAGIHNYSFTLFQSCFCPGGQPMRITVQDDKVLRASNARGGAATEALVVGQPLTLSDIFQKIEEAYAKPADHIRLTLNPQYGYPERVTIDYVEMMADEELIYTISDFTR
jgi:outer membrane lipoprotein-sorting protein